jgi:hypothetical protein
VPATATTKARLTAVFQVSGRCCAASMAAAFVATGAGRPALSASPSDPAEDGGWHIVMSDDVVDGDEDKGHDR